MRTNVLDHGYVELIESWGSDERIIESARMSTAKGFLGWGPKHTDDCASSLKPPRQAGQEACDCVQKPGDEKLLAYLWEHRHTTPFELAGAVFEIKAPIFVFREWHRHRTQSYNEMSARYVPLPDENYMPSMERCLLGGGTNKQAQGAFPPGTPAAAACWVDEVEALYRYAESVYQSGLKKGMPKELARIVLPVGRYSRMRAQALLKNWLDFLTLRMAPNAQWEIRQYADAVHDELVKLFPRTLQLFDEGRTR